MADQEPVPPAAEEKPAEEPTTAEAPAEAATPPPEPAAPPTPPPEEKLPEPEPPAEAPPDEAQPAEAPPAEAPPAEAPSADAPPDDAPPAEAPPVEAPPADASEAAPIAPQSSLEKLIKTSSMQIAQSAVRLAEAAEAKTESRGEKNEKTAKEVVGDLIEVRRGSLTDATGVPKVAKFLPTYKMEPDKPYNPEKVITILEQIMEEAFETFIALTIDEEGNETDIKYFLPYNAEMCAKQAKWVSETLRTKIKEMRFDRYKLITICTIGEKNQQDIYCCSRFLWDFEKDNYTKYSIENPYIFGYALVFALYYE